MAEERTVYLKLFVKECAYVYMCKRISDFGQMCSFVSYQCLQASDQGLAKVCLYIWGSWAAAGAESHF